ERDGEAIAAYTRYLAEVSDIDPQERDQVKRDLETLNASAVRVHLTILVHDKPGADASTVHDARLPVRGSSILNVYQGASSVDLVIRPGRHVMAVRLQGRASPSWEFEAVPGARISRTFVIEKEELPKPTPAASDRPSPSRAAPTVVIGLGGAALVAGGVLGL